MAGGALAAFVTCPECLFDDGVLTKAMRVSEGYETDQYVCERRHRFGIDWARGPATEPQWPPPAEMAALAKPRSDG